MAREAGPRLRVTVLGGLLVQDPTRRDQERPVCGAQVAARIRPLVSSHARHAAAVASYVRQDTSDGFVQFKVCRGRLLSSLSCLPPTGAVSSILFDDTPAFLAYCRTFQALYVAFTS
jgi:hypothetical protein